jgi:hypothetical protein
MGAAVLVGGAAAISGWVPVAVAEPVGVAVGERVGVRVRVAVRVLVGVTVRVVRSVAARVGVAGADVGLDSSTGDGEGGSKVRVAVGA